MGCESESHQEAIAVCVNDVSAMYVGKITGFECLAAELAEFQHPFPLSRGGGYPVISEVPGIFDLPLASASV